MNTQATNFVEKQRFTQWWIWLLFLLISAVIGVGAYVQLVLNQPFGNNPMSNTGLVVFIGLWIVFLLFFFTISLRTEIDQTKITIQYIPFIWRKKNFEFNDLDKLYLKTYSPIMDYGGWGLRYSLSGKGKAYTISGKIGLQLEFKDGKKILIGTKQNEALNLFLKQIYDMYPNLIETKKG